MDKELLNLYEHTKKVNKDLIKRSMSVMPCCLIMKKSREVIMMGLAFTDGREKEIMRNIIRKLILSQDIIGYIFVADTKMSMIDTKDNTKSVCYDVIMSNLYTAQEKLVDLLFYDGTKILDMKDNKVLEGLTHLNRKEAQDSWDVWGSSVEINDKVTEKYDEFKKSNLDKFKDVK